MILNAMVGLLTYVDRDGTRHQSLHGDTDSAQAALAELVRQQWDRVAGHNLGNGLAVAAEPHGLNDNDTITLYFKAINNSSSPQTAPESSDLQWLPVTLDAVTLMMTRERAGRLLNDARRSIGDFTRACEQGDFDAVEAAGRDVRDETDFYAGLLEGLTTS